MESTSTRSDGGVLVVAAHPDDETIGAFGWLRAHAGRCSVVHVTDGAPKDRRFFPTAAWHLSRTDYARARRSEVLRALALAGLYPSEVIALDVPDTEGSFVMAWLAERIRAIFTELRPRAIVTHAYEGGHPDHDATAFAVHAAAAMATGPSRPVLVEMTSYHDRDGEVVRGHFLDRSETPTLALRLDAEDRRRKREMFSMFATQRDVLEPFDLTVERYRRAPTYRFREAPHGGSLHYERAGFSLSGARWRALAEEATRALSLDRGGL